jgi:hypothetical protein
VNRWPPPSLRHLARLTDEVGIIEHARYDRPRWDLGYCTDDAGRLLAVVSKLASDPDARRLATVALRFLTRAHEGGGRFRLRLAPDAQWTDDPPSDDAAGRALFGLGTAAARAPWPEVRTGALDLFDAAVGFRSAHSRAVAYAGLGAVAVLDVIADHDGARRLVADAAHRLVADAAHLLPGAALAPGWQWPEPRLSYANALIPEARLAVAAARGDRQGARDALSLLDWLVREESREGWFSFAPVGGRGPGEVKPAFDQQPIEAWAMADACARAHAYTGDPHWADAVRRAVAWFVGDNDVGVAVFDAASGGGFDGLEPQGVNRNQGAESTLAFVATMAQARALRRRAQAARSRPAAASASSR